MIFDPAETMSVDERASLQLTRLRALVDRLLRVNGEQAARLKEAGIDAGAGITLEDRKSDDDYAD